MTGHGKKILLLLIGWSSSFIFLVMQKVWRLNESSW